MLSEITFARGQDDAVHTLHSGETIYTFWD